MVDFRVGCVPYLNAWPLVARLSHRVEVQYDVPSQLHHQLKAGSVQAILVSSIEAIKNNQRFVVDGAGISTLGPVLSVRLFSKVPFETIQSLALDTSSMTSNALAQILLGEVYGCKPKTVQHEPDFDAMLSFCDAAVIIGDSGMRAPGLPVPFGHAVDGLHILDLGSAWTELTGLPFVWALWTANQPIAAELCEALIQAKHAGIENLEALIPEAVQKFGFSADLTQHYLGSIMSYDTTPEHWNGLKQFGNYCQTYGFVESATMPNLCSSQISETIV